MKRASHEVWAKVAWAAVDVAARGGLAVDTLFDGLPFDAVSIRAMRRVDWTDYCTLIERIESLAGGPEPCAKLLEAQYHTGFSEFSAVASAVISPKALFRAAATVTLHLFPPIDIRVFDAGLDRLRVEVRLRDGARPSTTFFRGSVGTFAGVTRHIGLPPARVEAELSDHHGDYQMCMPPSRTLLARGRRWGQRRGFASRFVLGVDEDGSPMSTTIGEAPDAGLPERLAAAVETWELTRRQSDVLAVLARGKSNKEIAGEIGCAENTVELHVTQLLRRTGASSRSELIARFWSEL